MVLSRHKYFQDFPDVLGPSEDSQKASVITFCACTVAAPNGMCQCLVHFN